jgi:hypothetical protein
LRLSAIIGVVGLLSGAAGAQEEVFVPVTPTEQVYLHCGDNAVASVGSSATYAWDTDVPTGSYTTGSGCGQLDVSPQTGDEPVFTGTYAGNLDRLTVHAWVIDAGLERTGLFPEVWTQMRLLVDGVEVAAADDLKIVPQPSETGLSRLLEFSVTDIGLLAEEDNVEHSVELQLGSMPYDDGDTIAWVLDATEIASGLTFSPSTLAATRVRAR